MIRKIISIDHDKCNGCGLCIPNCPEGAIQLIDGKARLVSDLFCDGLGTCLGRCPEGAISVLEREAQPYDEQKVMENIIPQGQNVIKAHLQHLKGHGENDHFAAACTVLKQRGIPVATSESPSHPGGCPGARSSLIRETTDDSDVSGKRPPELAAWPIQLHLIPPRAAHHRGKELLLSADCAAFAAGDFHKDFLKGKLLAIACPKLDEGQEIYREKLRLLIAESCIASLTIVTMEVPCCASLVQLAEQALDQAGNTTLAVFWNVISIQGEVVKRIKIQ